MDSKEIILFHPQKGFVQVKTGPSVVFIMLALFSFPFLLPLMRKDWFFFSIILSFYILSNVLSMVGFLITVGFMVFGIYYNDLYIKRLKKQEYIEVQNI